MLTLSLIKQQHHTAPLQAMAAASSPFHKYNKAFVLLLFLINILPLLPPPLMLLVSSASAAASAASTTTSSSDLQKAAVENLCSSTPYPAACLRSFKLSLGITIPGSPTPSLSPYLLQSLQSAITEGAKLLPLLATAGNPGVVEAQRGTLQDCRDLQLVTLSCLRRSVPLVQSGRRLSDVRTYLSAALTNRATCLEGLSVASGPLKGALVGAVAAAYEFVANCLSILSNKAPPPPPQPPAGTLGRRRRLLQVSASGGLFPSWLSRRDRRLLQSDNGYDSSLVLTVAADGTGNFTGVGDAVAFAPSNSDDRTVVIVRAGVYVENVVIPSDKTNIVFLGDGSDVTVIRGSRSVGDGWTTFRSATLAVSGEGFLARDITFENAAGAAKGQAVALRVNADLAAFYRCSMSGHQDTLYAHSFRQFYRECEISGTVDFIFGNAAVTFQGCNIVPRLPLRGQYNAITAQGRDDPNMNTGTSIHNCTIVASADLLAGNGAGSAASIKTYLGRPWKPYSRTVFMKTYMGELVDAAGWTEWDGQTGLDTLYYGEYDNEGPGSATDRRVAWPGYHVMGYDDAVDFTVDQLIDGYGWLESTSFPYDDGV